MRKNNPVERRFQATTQVLQENDMSHDTTKFQPINKAERKIQ